MALRMHMRAAMRWFLLAPVLVTACVGSDKESIVEPTLGAGKGDVSEHVADRGALAFGAARTGSFDQDLQFDGYHLTVRAGAVVTLDNTHLGTASRLDSTLFVFGPRGAGGFGTDAIAFDDDNGWGRHARIRELHLPEAGEYLVVLGTADARGRGHYRLEARCESGACEPVPEPAACDPALADGIQQCIAGQIADGDLEADATVSYADALAACTDGEQLGAAFDQACASANPPAFCDLDFETFATTQVPPCADELGARTGLCGSYLEDALAAVVDGMWFTSESDYPYEVVSWPGAGAPTAANVPALAGFDASAEVETTDFDRVFGWRARAPEPDMDEAELDAVLRHRHLRRVLEDNLTDTLVVRIGLIQVHVFVVGRTSCGDLAGVSTVSIET